MKKTYKITAAETTQDEKEVKLYLEPYTSDEIKEAEPDLLTSVMNGGLNISEIIKKTTKTLNQNKTIVFVDKKDWDLNYNLSSLVDITIEVKKNGCRIHKR